MSPIHHPLSLVIAMVANHKEKAAAEIIKKALQQRREIYYLTLSKNGDFLPVRVFLSAEEIAKELSPLLKIKAAQLSEIILAEQATRTWVELKKETEQIIFYLKTQQHPYQPANTTFKIISKQNGDCSFHISREINTQNLIDKIKKDIKNFQK